ncbi:hypothetical protein FOCC_FOCC013149 [Frankliniella occidentalis]|nr:hypothetical protein FOCC_FOCC013149 [Frankliniella occidentalis]
MASVATLSVPPALDVILRDIAAKHGFRESKIHVTSGSGAGDGYSSTVYRATITDDIVIQHSHTYSNVFAWKLASKKKLSV